MLCFAGALPQIQLLEIVGNKYRQSPINWANFTNYLKNFKQKFQTYTHLFMVITGRYIAK